MDKNTTAREIWKRETRQVLKKKAEKEIKLLPSEIIGFYHPETKADEEEELTTKNQKTDSVTEKMQKQLRKLDDYETYS